MTPRGLGVTLGAAAGLVLVPAAVATQQAVTGKLTVTGTGTDYILTVENASTSTGPIRCWRWELGQGAMVTAAARVEGWQLGLNKPAPAPIIGGKSDTGIPPGGKVQFRILTDKPFDPNGSPGVGRISEDCKADVPAPLGFGSPPAPPPKPEPKPCACKDLKTRIVPNRLLTPRNVATGLELEVLVEWTLTCTKGNGKCSGDLTLVPSVRAKRLGASVPAPAGGKVTCSGPCAKKNVGFQKFVVTAGPRYGEGRRGRTEKLLRLEMKRKCKSTKLAQVFLIAFTKSGAVDSKQSDLNANGIADGRKGG